MVHSLSSFFPSFFRGVRDQSLAVRSDTEGTGYSHRCEQRIWKLHVLSWVVSDPQGPPASSFPSQALQACSSPRSLSNDVGKAGTMCVATLAETRSPGTLCRGLYSNKGSGHQRRMTLKMPKSALPQGCERKLQRSLKNGGKTGRQKGKKSK